MSKKIDGSKRCNATCPGCHRGKCNEQLHHKCKHHCPECDLRWRSYKVIISVIGGIIALIALIISPFMAVNPATGDNKKKARKESDKADHSDRCGAGCTYPVDGKPCGEPCAKPKAKWHLGHRCVKHILSGG